VSYDRRTRRQAKTKFLQVVASVTGIVVAGLFVVAANSLETYWNVPLFASAKNFFGVRETGEFSLSKKMGLNDILDTTHLDARLPASDSWKLESNIPPQNRSHALQEILKREKLLSLEFESILPLARVREYSQLKSPVFAERRSLVLLPGENLRLAAAAFKNLTPKLTARCLGVTADKKDSKALLEIATQDGLLAPIELSTQGKPLSFTIPRTRPDQEIILRWPANAPGIFSFMGEETPRADLPGIVLITLDHIAQGLSDLPLTTQAARNIDSSLQTLSPIWPASEKNRDNLASALTGISPSNLGLTAPNEAYASENPFGVPQTIEEKLAKKGYHSFRLNLRPADLCEPCDHHVQVENILELAKFDVSVGVRRLQEIQTGLGQILGNFDGVTSGLFLHIAVEMPASKMKLTWSSALSERGSILTWLRSAWTTGEQSEATHELEKNIQLDQTLSELIRNIQKNSKPAPNIFILVGNTSQTPSNSAPARPGELLAPAAAIGNAKPSVLSQTSLESLILLNQFNSQNQGIAAVQGENEEVFVLTDGWMSLPVVTSANQQKYFGDRVHVPFSSLEATQNTVQKYRDSYTIQALHILFPSVAENETLTGELQAPFPLLSCRAPESEDTPEIQVSGEGKSILRFKKTSHRPLATWQLTCFVDAQKQTFTKDMPAGTAALDVSRGGQPLSRDRIGIGEYALSGALFPVASSASRTQIPTSRAFLSASAPPQFPKPFAKMAYIWLERYPTIPRATGSTDP
jgi:hypothetical protein